MKVAYNADGGELSTSIDFSPASPDAFRVRVCAISVPIAEADCTWNDFLGDCDLALIYFYPGERSQMEYAHKSTHIDLHFFLRSHPGIVWRPYLPPVTPIVRWIRLWFAIHVDCARLCGQQSSDGIGPLAISHHRMPTHCLLSGFRCCKRRYSSDVTNIFGPPRVGASMPDMCVIYLIANPTRRVAPFSLTNFLLAFVTFPEATSRPIHLREVALGMSERES